MDEYILNQIKAAINDPDKAATVVEIIHSWEKKQKQEQLANQARGIAAAQKKGIRFGRPKIPITPAFIELYKLTEQQKISVTLASKTLGVDRKTFRRLRDEYRASQQIAKAR